MIGVVEVHLGLLGLVSGSAIQSLSRTGLGKGIRAMGACNMAQVERLKARNGGDGVVDVGAGNGEDVGEAMVGDGVAREYGSGRRNWC